MKTKLKSILHFLIPALEVRELRRAAADYEDQIVRLSNTIGELRDLVNSAPTFYDKAVRDDQFGTEIAEAIKDEAVEKLAPALSREYVRILNQIAWKMPPPESGVSGPPGSMLSAYEAGAAAYRVRIELPSLSYNMTIGALR